MEYRLHLRRDHKGPLSWRGIVHVTQFQSFQTPYNFWTNYAIRFKFGIQIKHFHVTKEVNFLRMDHKLCCWSVVDLFSYDTCKTANVNHRHINNNKTANIKDKNLKVYNDV